MSTTMRPVAGLDEETRADFIVRVYQHLLGAIALFVGFEVILFQTGIAERIFDFVNGGGLRWLLILGGVAILNWFAANAAADFLEPSRQYLGLLVMALGQALIFAPFLYYVFNYQEGGTATVGAAVAITAVGFVGLSVVGFVTRKDLSFLRPLVMWGFVIALVLIVAAVIFGLELGIWFSVAMIGLAGAAILYQTQSVLRSYPQEAHVAAALALFASVMTLFWYVLRLLSQLRS